MTERRSCRTAHPGELAQAIAAAKAEARAAGLTDAEIDAELAAYNTERRSVTHRLGEEVAPVYDATQADPGRVLDAAQVEAALRAHHAARLRK